MLYYEYLLMVQKDYKDMRRRYHSLRRQEFLRMPLASTPLAHQMELLNEQATQMITSWPKYNMHNMIKCQLPEHPCQIQVLELPPELQIAEADKGNSPALRRLSTASLTEIRTPLELLLGQRPQWTCLEEVKTAVRDLHMQYATLRREYTDRMGTLEIPAETDLQGCLQYFHSLLQLIEEYKEVVSSEVTLIAQYLLSCPETPVCLYGIMPDTDSLPHFFPVIYPYTQEPKDAEDYVETCDKLKAWRARLKDHIKFMDQVFEGLQADADKGQLTADAYKDGLDSIKAVYEQWSIHQKTLIGHCNELLQTSLLASRIPARDRRTPFTVERDIAEQLLGSRIHHNKALPEGWMATAEWCMELAKARFDDGADTVYSDRLKSRVQLTLQDREILSRNKTAVQAREQKKAAEAGGKQ